MPCSQELTTQQAADLLNVSRPHVVTLLESGVIPFHRVGTHRRICLKHLLEYKDHRDSARRRELQSMVDEAQETGVYDE
jgi:excisionase family DNA binding protein